MEKEKKVLVLIDADSLIYQSSKEDDMWRELGLLCLQVYYGNF